MSIDELHISGKKLIDPRGYHKRKKKNDNCFKQRFVDGLNLLATDQKLFKSWLPFLRKQMTDKVKYKV